MKAFTEERTITAIDGTTVTLDRALQEDHQSEGDYRGEVANLSRNVVVESADPAQGRGHTMYHRGSAGSIALRRVPPPGQGRDPRQVQPPLPPGRRHDARHLRVGASFWDSGNRWITIHGTNYLVVRDCVGYQSVGHGFFLEDGTEVDNVLDRNLAVQAFTGKPLPGQMLPFDNNGGAGFWWANSRNTFTRNVAVECDRYGYKFEATPLNTPRLAPECEPGDDEPEIVRPPPSRSGTPTARGRPSTSVRSPSSGSKTTRLTANSTGSTWASASGGSVPTHGIPFVLRNTRLWNNFWAFRPARRRSWSTAWTSTTADTGSTGRFIPTRLLRAVDRPGGEPTSVRRWRQAQGLRRTRRPGAGRGPTASGPGGRPS